MAGWVKLIRHVGRLLGVAAGISGLSGTALAEPSSPLALYPALMDTLVGGHYAAARTICEQIETGYPGHPAGTYARIAVGYARMIDLEDSMGRSEFMARVDSCVRKCEQAEDTALEQRAMTAYLKGSALASKGLLLNHEGKTLPALRTLIRARKQFDEAIESDPQFYDAYLGRGAYRYAVATHASLVRWLPFIPSRDSGWQDLWLAVARSRFSRATAMTSIVWHLMDEGRFAAADSMIQIGLERFPNCRNFLWPKLAYYERQKRWAEAEQTAKALLNQYLALAENNGHEAIGLYWRLMTCADALGRSDDAKAYALAGLATFRTPAVAHQRDAKLHELENRLSRP